MCPKGNLITNLTIKLISCYSLYFQVPLKGVNKFGHSSKAKLHVLTSNVTFNPDTIQLARENGGNERSSFYIDPTGVEEFTAVSPDRDSRTPVVEPLPLVINNPNPAVSIVRPISNGVLPQWFLATTHHQTAGR